MSLNMEPMFHTSGSVALALISAIALVAAARLDGVALIMMALVLFIACIIHAYSRRYLDGQPAAARHRRWFIATIACTALLVSATDLRLIAMAWTGSSLSLHQLLTFFSSRRSALVAAHKKFLLSRLADVAIYLAVFLIGREFATYEIRVINELAVAQATLTPSVHIAGMLLVFGVALRSAQLPFHGWLIQVMETPTPVSALLHAGVVNIGGYVLIRLASLMNHLPAAQFALVSIGGTTAVLAAIVMMTRVSIKASLAWSTAAQMGFMLLECGLGAWDLALLHLVAHSCYKAYAFLSSGSVVTQFSEQQIAAPPRQLSVTRWLWAGVAGSLVAATTGWFAWPDLVGDTRLWIALSLLSLTLVTIFARIDWHGRVRLRTNVRLAAAAVGFSFLYAVIHRATSTWLPFEAPAPHPVAIAFTLCAFGVLLVAQVLVTARPHSRITRATYAWAFAGFYLDDVFTRITFLVWPPRFVRPAHSPRATSTMPLYAGAEQ